MNRHTRRAMEAQTAAFVKERDAMLRTLDPAEMARFAAKWNVPQPARWLPNADLACMHKARLAITTFSEEEKTASRRWLLERGFVAAAPGIAERAVGEGAA